MLRISSPLADEVETLIHETIGCCIAVHRALGPGLMEAIYSRAVGIELAAVGIPSACEASYPVIYRGQVLCHQRLDLVVDDRLILEIKAVECLNQLHRAQLLSYLRVATIRAGLLINFNVPVLQDGIKRIVL